MGDIIFVGGIHGVGKGKICKELSTILNRIHLSASDVLKWNEVSPDEKNKKVVNISNTQDRLISGLKRVIEDDKCYLLDGHFCLLNSMDDVSQVPFGTFQAINPKIISVVTEEVEIIHERIMNRDSRAYNLNLLSEMQTQEVEYAIEIANKLKVPFVEVNKGNYSKLLYYFGVGI